MSVIARLATQTLNRQTIKTLIDRAILDGLSNAQIRLRLRACGYNTDISRIERRRKIMQNRGVPV